MAAVFVAGVVMVVAEEAAVVGMVEEEEAAFAVVFAVFPVFAVAEEDVAEKAMRLRRLCWRGGGSASDGTDDRLLEGSGWGFGLGVWGVGLRVWNLGCRVWVLGCTVWGLGFGVWGLGFGVWR